MRNVFSLTMATAFVGLCVVPAQGEGALSVRDPRPVALAVQQLEALHSRQISYEDPPYSSPEDIDDVTNQVARQPVPKDVHILIPKSRTLTVPGIAREPRIAAAITKLLAAYGQLVGFNGFRVFEEGGFYHVAPIKARDTSGRVYDITPILDTKIGIQPRQRSAYELIAEICEKTSHASGTTMVFGTAPDSLLRNVSTTVATTGRKVSARVLLEQLDARTGLHLSWQLYFDPRERFYVLNIHTVEPPGARN